MAYERHFSASQVILYENCPHKYYKAYVEPANRKELPSDICNDGKKGHDEIANYIINHGEKPSFLPDKFDGFLGWLGEGKFEVETKIKIDYLQFNLIGYLDLYVKEGVKVTIVDWKTGYKDGNELQLKTYALGLFKKYPDLQVAICYFYYTSKNGFHPKFVYTREDIDRFEIELEDKLYEIYDCKEFLPKASSLCNTCKHAWHCMEASLYNFDRCTCIEEFNGLQEKLQIAEGFAKSTKEVLKQYMIENNLDTVVNGVEKAYLTTAVTMRTGSLKKDELIDMILEMKPESDKKELSKMKIVELTELIVKPQIKKSDVIVSEEEKKLIETHTNDKELTQEEIDVIVSDDTAEVKTKTKREPQIIPVQDVNSKTLKADLIVTIKDYLKATGKTFSDFSKIPMAMLQRADLYKVFKEIVSTPNWKECNELTDEETKTAIEKHNSGETKYFDPTDEEYPSQDVEEFDIPF